MQVQWNMANWKSTDRQCSQRDPSENPVQKQCPASRGGGDKAGDGADVKPESETSSARVKEKQTTTKIAPLVCENVAYFSWKTMWPPLPLLHATWPLINNFNYAGHACRALKNFSSSTHLGQNQLNLVAWHPLNFGQVVKRYPPWLARRIWVVII